MGFEEVCPVHQPYSQVGALHASLAHRTDQSVHPSRKAAGLAAAGGKGRQAVASAAAAGDGCGPAWHAAVAMLAFGRPAAGSWSARMGRTLETDSVRVAVQAAAGTILIFLVCWPPQAWRALSLNYEGTTPMLVLVSAPLSANFWRWGLVGGWVGGWVSGWAGTAHLPHAAAALPRAALHAMPFHARHSAAARHCPMTSSPCPAPPPPPKVLFNVVLLVSQGRAWSAVETGVQVAGGATLGFGCGVGIAYLSVAANGGEYGTGGVAKAAAFMCLTGAFQTVTTVARFRLAGIQLAIVYTQVL